MTTKGQQMYCKDCGATIVQQEEKALSGEVQTVWAETALGGWICHATGNEHVPGTPRHPVQVIVKCGDRDAMIRLSLAEFGNLVVSPLLDTLDDGDVAWELREGDPERHASIERWANGLYGVTGA